ncbi:hypothetical protein LTR22_027103 [Elasticomyces elasticus]|nr:hypothetical protein LTR22_027103 [Elasticomyces elasticus]
MEISQSSASDPSTSQSTLACMWSAPSTPHSAAIDYSNPNDRLSLYVTPDASTSLNPGDQLSDADIGPVARAVDGSSKSSRTLKRRELSADNKMKETIKCTLRSEDHGHFPDKIANMLRQSYPNLYGQQAVDSVVVRLRRVLKSMVDGKELQRERAQGMNGGPSFKYSLSGSADHHDITTSEHSSTRSSEGVGGGNTPSSKRKATSLRHGESKVPRIGLSQKPGEGGVAQAQLREQSDSVKTTRNALETRSSRLASSVIVEARDSSRMGKETTDSPTASTSEAGLQTTQDTQMLQANVEHPSTCDNIAVHAINAGGCSDQPLEDFRNGVHGTAADTIQVEGSSQGDSQPQIPSASPDDPSIAVFTQSTDVQQPAHRTSSGAKPVRSELMIWGQMVKQRREFGAKHKELTKQSNVLLGKMEQLKSENEDIRNRAVALEQQLEELRRLEVEKRQECDSVNGEVAEAAKELDSIKGKIQKIDENLFGQ